MKARTVHLPWYFKGIREVERQLDRTNVKILSAMWKYGPRNLLEVSRRIEIPFTTVYHRVSKLETASGRLAYLVPRTSRMGMVRVVFLAAANPGCEGLLTDALKVPNLWRSINTCEGPFTQLSVHTVPVQFLKDFKIYAQRLLQLGVVKRYRLIRTGDHVTTFPNFRYYDQSSKQWAFQWKRWLTRLREAKPGEELVDPEEYPMLADGKDLLIVKELEKNARTSFADLAPVLGISLQGVKYHYDKRLVPSGIIQYFAFDVYPHPVEVSAYHESMLEFTSKEAMNRFFSLRGELFFVHGVAKVLGRNELIVRTYTPGSELRDMFTFFSEMAKADMLASYSSVRLDFAGREAQTISYELFDEHRGWVLDPKRCLLALSDLAGKKNVPALRPRDPRRGRSDDRTTR